MNSSKWQQIYQRALGKVVTEGTGKLSARQMPIVRRSDKANRDQALQDAAAALSALWRQPLKQH